MSISPLINGRLPNSLILSQLQQNLAEGNRALQQLQQQSITGQKFFLPSESPVAALRTIVLQKEIERTEQFQENVQTDRSLLTLTETALASVGDALVRSSGIVLAGIGDTVSREEQAAFADEVSALLEQVVQAGNTKYRGRYLFAGSRNENAPFSPTNAGAIRYNGDQQSIQSFVDLDFLLANNVDGDTAFAALSPPVGDDLSPALSLSSKLADLHRGLGLQTGQISVTLEDAAIPLTQTETVDLTNAKTIGDVKTILEDAFAAGPLNLTVGLNATQDGLQLTPGAGVTVAVSNVAGSTLADDLGIASAAVAQIDGTDLEPQLTTQTLLSDLNSGSGIDLTGGLLIENGTKSTLVTIPAAPDATVENLLNAIRLADPDLEAGIDSDKNALAISTRLIGSQLSIGENGGTTAADLGIRTLAGSTLLAEMNSGFGVPVDEGTLDITRRDGSVLNIDLSGSVTVQDVLDKINAVDPPYLQASLNGVGNGIAILDNPALALSSPIAAGELGSLVLTLDDGVPQSVTVDLSGAATVQDVKQLLETAIPGPPSLTVDIDPGTNHGLILTASGGATVEIAETGVPGSTTAADLAILGGPAASISGGITAPQVVGVGPLVINPTNLSVSLGIDGEVSDPDPTTPLEGRDVHRRESSGVMGLLLRLDTALRAGDDRELERISLQIQEEIDRFNGVRGEVGTRLRILDNVENRLLDDELATAEALSIEFDADITEVITQIASQQQSLQATLTIAASSLQLSLFNFL